MSTEETELMFTRCVQCRSLIPAVAARCRICGAVAPGRESESSQVSGEKTDVESKPRIRQKTISVTSDNLEMLKRSYAETEKNAAETGNSNNESTSSHVSDLTENVALEGQSAGPKVDWNIASSESEAISGSEENDQKLLGEAINLIRERKLQSGEDPKVRQPEVEHRPDNQPSGMTEGEPRSKRRRRRRKRKSGLIAEASIIPPREKIKNLETADEPSAESDLKEENNKKEQGEQQMSYEGVSNGREQSQNAAQNIGRDDRISSEISQDSKLIGWIVDLGRNGKVFSNEIREGQFFITKQKLRAYDYVIDDVNVSVPHSLIVATGNGLTIQDLMSEKGTFIKRHGETSYVRCFEPFELGHGDYIRVGLREFQVCLRPSDSIRR
jgi:hypothetical protein